MTLEHQPVILRTHLDGHLLKSLLRHLGLRHGLGGVSSRHSRELAARVLAGLIVDGAEAIPHLRDVTEEDHDSLN